MKYIFKSASLAVFVVAPMLVSAQSTSALLGHTSTTLASYVNNLVAIINAIIPLFAGIAVVLFFIGLIRYIFTANDVKGRAAGRETIKWGLIGLFCIFTLGGIIKFLVALLP